jgi:hypothetical protein
VSFRLLAHELQVDVLERRAPHLELLQLAALGERAAGELVNDARRLLARVGSSVCRTCSSPFSR